MSLRRGRRRSSERDRIGAGVFRAIADYTYDWETWIDAAGRVRWVNPAVFRITGYSVAECLAMQDYPLPLVFAADRRIISRAMRSGARGGTGNDVEFRILNRSGEVLWGAMSWQSIWDRRGRPLGYRTSVRDITSRKTAEDELRQAKAEAERASRTKTEFLRTMSHEIRSPIQCISGYAQLLANTALSERQRRYVNVMNEQNDALLSVIDDILEFSALSTADPRLESIAFSPKALIEQVLNGLAPLAASKGLELSHEVAGLDALILTGDVHRLRQILVNLVNNAVKFTVRGWVRVAARFEPRCSPESGELIVSVADSGVGISADVLPRLFRPFSQADVSVARRFGGSGLGLAISTRLANLMGGKIAATSAPGQGSVFTLSVPLPIDHEVSYPGPLSTVPNLGPVATGLSILVVDDNDVARELAQEMLTELGCASDAAPDAASALEALSQRAYDVILMDIQMPDMDGLTLTRRIRSEQWPHGTQPTIAALSANVLSTDRAACERAGMDAFLGKPLRLASLAGFLGGVRGRLDKGSGGEARAVFREEHSTQDAPATTRKRKGRKEILDTRLVSELREIVDATGRSLWDRQIPRVVEELNTLRSALSQNQPSLPDLASLAHRVKGHARLVGARQAASAANEVESRARSGRPPSPTALEMLQRRIDGLIEILNEGCETSRN